jgi:hypothetical protein
MNITRNRRLSSGVAGLAIATIAITGCQSNSSSTGASDASVKPSATATTTTKLTDPNGQQCVSYDSTGYCPGDDPTTPPAPTAPAMTTEQQQAVDAAQGYLSLGQGFSYAGLLQQLTSSAGNGFSKSDAEFAINYVKPDWDQQAVDAAKGYLSLGEGFSRSSLLQQLTSSYGDGFTQAQAEYGVDKAMPN